MERADPRAVRPSGPIAWAAEPSSVESASHGTAARTGTWMAPLDGRGGLDDARGAQRGHETRRGTPPVWSDKDASARVNAAPAVLLPETARLTWAGQRGDR